MKRIFALVALVAFSAFAAPYAFRPTVSVSVTTSPTAIASNTRHSFVLVCNNGSAAVYWSFDSAVTSSTGMPLKPSDCITFDSLSQGQILYGAAATGTIDVRVAEGFAQ